MVRMQCGLSEEFDAKMGMHQSVLSTFLLVAVIDVVTKLARGGMICELLYADDLVLIIEII